MQAPLSSAGSTFRQGSMQAFGRPHEPQIHRELEQYGVFDKQLFPDLDGLAKWLKFKVYNA